MSVDQNLKGCLTTRHVHDIAVRDIAIYISDRDGEICNDIFYPEPKLTNSSCVVILHTDFSNFVSVSISFLRSMYCYR